MPDRFFFEGPLGPGMVELSGPEAHHLGTVRRLAPGHQIALFNGDGSEYFAEIVSVARKSVMLQVLSVQSFPKDFPFPIHIAAALPKGDRGDFLIEKLTELGVTDFTPLKTDRGVVQPGGEKVEKLRRAVIEASKQCGRNVLMRVHQPTDVAGICSQPDLPQLRYIAHPEASCLFPPPSTLHPIPASIFLIGPEGGFSTEEVQVAQDAGWMAVSLGPRILRVETAAVAVASWFALSFSNPGGAAPQGPL